MMCVDAAHDRWQMMTPGDRWWPRAMMGNENFRVFNDSQHLLEACMPWNFNHWPRVPGLPISLSSSAPFPTSYPQMDNACLFTIVYKYYYVH